MKAKIGAIWDNLHSSFWFIPSLMTFFAAALALGMVKLDRSESVRGAEFLYSGGAEGARSMLSAIASSVLSLAGVTFSITIAALTLASGQFGPRLLRNFIRDRGNQIVLGAFIGTFLYCLLVLREVRGVEEIRFVPHLAVTVAIALAVGCLGALIYFVHHISQGIQAAQVIANVGREFDEAVERMFPNEVGRDPRETAGVDENHPEKEIPADFERNSRPVASQSGGYVQILNGDGLMKTAEQHDCVVQLLHPPGALVIEGDVLARVWPRERATEEMENAVNAAFSFGIQRTDAQDALFPINQLTEIAVRALSPGINDPFTAMMCLDRQARALALLAKREIPSGLRYDDAGELRVVTEPLTFEEVANAAFDSIRHYGSSDARVSAHILDILARLAPHLKGEDDRATLRRHADKTLQAARSNLSLDFEIAVVEAHHAAALRALHAREGKSDENGGDSAKKREKTREETR